MGILEQLSMNRLALTRVANSPQIAQHPKVLQALLQIVATVPSEEETPNAAQVLDDIVEDRKNEASVRKLSECNLADAYVGEDKESAAKVEIPSDLPANKVLVLTGKVAPTTYIAK